MQPSMSRYSTISQQDFRPIDVGGESGSLAPDPKNASLVYGGTVTKEIPATGWEQNIDPTLNYPGIVWRNAWTLPLAFSPADRTSLYFGRQNVFRSRDGGKTWQIISPDLSRADTGTPSNLDAATLADDNNVHRHGVVYAIAPSPLRANLIWAGTDDGYVWVTRPSTGSGQALSWKNVTPPGLTPWSKVGIIEASHFDPAVAYVAIDRHRLNDYKPYIYSTRDGGTSWTAIAAGIPDGSFVNVVREDPKRRGLLYAGTEKGVYVSFNDGSSWQPLQLNLPVTSIRDIAVHGDDLAIATHGRAFWIMDDITPLRQMADAVAARGAYLFAPAPAFRVRAGSFNAGTPLPLDEPQAQNAEVGLYIDYYLPDAARTPVVIDVLTPSGTIVRHWSSAERPQPTDPKSVDFTPHWITVHEVPAANAGGHRFIWDFRETSYKGPLVPPGSYTIRLSVNGRSLQSAATVVRDPRIAASDADLRSQYDLARQIETLRAEVAVSRTSAQQFAKKKLPPEQAQVLRTQIIGESLPENPDDSMGAYSHDFSSFLYLSGALDDLESAVDSADAAPTPDMRAAFGKLSAIYRQTLARFEAMKRS
jgi:hypothetical protein